MKIYRSLSELPEPFGPTVATIGNFDGVHRGHQWVITEVIARAKALSSPSTKELESHEESEAINESVIRSEQRESKDLRFSSAYAAQVTSPPTMVPLQPPSDRVEKSVILSEQSESKDLRFSSSYAAQVTSLAITFDPHPSRVLRPETSTLTIITPLEEKLALLAATGLDATLVLPFDHAFSKWTARDFATRVLRDGAHVIEVHEGEDFRFGHNAQAGIDSLSQLGDELGFTVKTYAPQPFRGAPVSSSRIRALIAAGDVSHARALLGTPFTILSTPASGRGYGTKYTVPTINLAPYAELLPANGVYITTITIGEGEASEIFEAVTNVGIRPTFGHIPGTPDHTVESHLLNFHPIALDESTPIRLSFLKYLRPEIKWPNPEALRTQIGLDVARARRFFTLCKPARS